MISHYVTGKPRRVLKVDISVRQLYITRCSYIFLLAMHMKTFLFAHIARGLDRSPRRYLESLVPCQSMDGITRRQHGTMKSGGSRHLSGQLHPERSGPPVCQLSHQREHKTIACVQRAVTGNDDNVTFVDRALNTSTMKQEMEAPKFLSKVEEPHHFLNVDIPEHETVPNR